MEFSLKNEIIKELNGNRWLFLSFQGGEGLSEHDPHSGNHLGKAIKQRNHAAGHNPTQEASPDVRQQW